MRIRISGAELDIMQYLWKREDGAAFAELLTYFNETREKEWCKQTLNTYLLRLNNRGLITKEKRGSKTIYSPAMTELRYRQLCAEEILNESYGGVLSNFLTALAGRDKITKADAQKIFDSIDKR
ncbi:MAG: BlaI/MecI/CopY family transcriptional regulator [Lachnospiraceae bacterium]|nr:BlaI/MecI/CopY family transcriptional regulator [Lachnospiraceae bacterium]